MPKVFCGTSLHILLLLCCDHAKRFLWYLLAYSPTLLRSHAQPPVRPSLPLFTRQDRPPARASVLVVVVGIPPPGQIERGGGWLGIGCEHDGIRSGPGLGLGPLAHSAARRRVRMPACRATGRSPHRPLLPARRFARRRRRLAWRAPSVVGASRRWTWALDPVHHADSDSLHLGKLAHAGGLVVGWWERVVQVVVVVRPFPGTRARGAARAQLVRAGTWNERGSQFSVRAATTPVCVDISSDPREQGALINLRFYVHQLSVLLLLLVVVVASCGG
jgi:hypothetical protein